MSYQAFNNFKTVDDENQQQQQQQAPKSTFTATPGSGDSEAAAPAPDAQVKSAPNSSGRFTNLQTYLSANKDFNQGKGLGGKITQGINQQADQYQKDLSQGAQEFNKQAAQGASGYYQPPAGSSEYVTPDTNYKQNDYIKNTLADPSKASDDDVKKFQGYTNAAYQGPQDLTQVQGKQNYGYLQNQAQGLQQNVKNAQTESGRFDLLKQMFNRPTYSTGQQGLDNLLIQSSPNQLQELQNAQQVAQKANLGLQKTEQGSSALANQYQTLANNTRTGVTGDLSKAITNIGDINDPNSTIAKELAATKGQIQTAYDPNANGSFANNLKGNNLTPEIAAALGLKNGDRLYGVNLSNPGYYNQNVSSALAQLNPQMAASQQDYANLAALGKLSGNANIGNAQGILSQFSNKDLSGTYNSLLPSLNTTTIKNDLAGKQAAYKAATDPNSSDPNNSFRQMNEAKAALTSKFAYDGDPYISKAPGYDTGGILGAMKVYSDELRRANPNQFKGTDMDIINMANSINDGTNTIQAKIAQAKGLSLLNAYNFETSKLKSAQQAAQGIQAQYGGTAGLAGNINTSGNTGIVNDPLYNDAYNALQQAIKAGPQSAQTPVFTKPNMGIGGGLGPVIREPVYQNGNISAGPIPQEDIGMLTPATIKTPFGGLKNYLR